MASLSEEFEGMKKNTTASADKLKLRESQHKRLLSHQYEAKSETLMAKRANSVNAMRKISYKHAHSSNVSNVDHIRVTSNKEVNHMTSSVDIFDSVNGISYLELVQSCNKFPALNELSKEVITQIKSTFKTLNLAIHAKTATPEEEITYKRLKRIIKGTNYTHI